MIQKGKWYRSHKSELILIYAETDPDNQGLFKCYGFNIEGKWLSPGSQSFASDNFYEISDEQAGKFLNGIMENEEKKIHNILEDMNLVGKPDVKDMDVTYKIIKTEDNQRFWDSAFISLVNSMYIDGSFIDDRVLERASAIADKMLNKRNS
jgi:hypothetical protein